MTNMTVAKFGGSSVKDAEAMLRVCNIVDSNPEIKIVVISATQNTTNHLEAISRASLTANEEERVNLIGELRDRHINIAKGLYSANETIDKIGDLAKEADDLSLIIKEEKNIRPQIMDQLYSIGERMSSLIVWDLCKLRMPEREVRFLDVREVLVTDSNFLRANPQIDLIAKEISKVVLPAIKDQKAKIMYVTQGFIGKDLNGHTTTLGREGSDYSAALLGEAIHADLVQIWTDVPGVASVDPRLTPTAKFIDSISYDEATSLATLGAKVLFPTTLAPAKRKSIPVFVGSSLKPELKGTIITASEDKEFALKAVTVLNKERVLSFIGSNIESNPNLDKKILEALHSYNLQFKNQSKNHISFTVNESENIQELFLKAHELILNFQH